MSLFTTLTSIFLLSGYAAADDGDDFSNNLFTDLGPLLALFGERVTMQFLSQAMGWSDCIILAVAPLGILTIIVAAIRVGGPPWLKALIGRATENIATAELELMSSTSNEVCEVWNGKDVVRCAGSAPVWEFICLLPSGKLLEDPVVEVMDIEKAEQALYIRNSSEAEISLWNKIRAFIPFIHIDAQNEARKDNDENQNIPRPSRDVIIVRNKRPAAPNISHNRYKNTGRRELYLAASFGIVLQISFLLYCGFITQYSKIKSGFQKDGNPVGSYAFPLTVIGTVVLNTGMLICSHVVESSTEEKIFRPAQGWRARLVWLQREQTVGDQEFKSFALFTGEDQPRIITSSRVEASSQQHQQGIKDSENSNFSNGETSRKDRDSGDQKATTHERSTTLEINTVFGTGISLIGFFAQFIGIRGMHWSVSVASLVAVLVMTAVRAWVRRGLTNPILSKSLLPGFELDWFADTLRDIGNAQWYKCSREMIEEKALPNNGDGQIPQVETSDICRDQQFIQRRQELAKLADWQGPVSQEAIVVTRAIEATMNCLDDHLSQNYYSSQKDLSWTYKVQIGESRRQKLKFSLKKTGDKWKANAGEIEAALSLRLFYVRAEEELKNRLSAKTNTKSSDPSDDAWLRGKTDIPQLGIRILGPRTLPLLRHLQWWIPANGPKIWKIQGIEDIAPETEDDSASGDIVLSAIENTGANSSDIIVEKSRVVGLRAHQMERVGTKNSVSLLPKLFHTYHQASQKKEELTPQKNSKLKMLEEKIKTAEYEDGDNELLAVKSQDSLEALYAKDIFSAFMWDFVNWLDPIKGKTDIQEQSVGDGESWNNFALHNDNISRLAQAIETTGLCKIYDAFINIIQPLSIQQKLPEVMCIVELVRNHAREFEARQDWKASGRTYLWLGDHLDAFRFKSKTYARAAAVLVAFILSLRETIERREAEKNVSGINNIKSLEEKLKQTMGNINEQLRHNLELLFKFQDDKNIRGPFCSKHQNPLYNSRHLYNKIWDTWARYRYVERIDAEEVKAKDIFERTLLHYIAALFCDLDAGRDDLEEQKKKNGEPNKDNISSKKENESREFLLVMQRILKHGVDPNARDIRGWTPLHYACQADNNLMVRFLLEKGASVDVQGRDGTAPIHCAARGGHLDTIKILLEFGAAVDVVDGSGSTALHLAAFSGSDEIIKILVKHKCRKLRDNWGRAAVHLATIAGHTALIDYFKDDTSSKDHSGKTPLHLAAEYSHELAVEQLLRIPEVDKNALDTMNRTPLHLACSGGHDDVVKTLLDAGAAIDATTYEEWTPLHYTAWKERESTVRLLTERNANVNMMDDNGRTALHWAAQTGNAAIVEHLLAMGADVNAGAGTSAGTPLHWASVISDNPVLPLILANPETKIDETDKEGNTALHKAAANCHLENIKTLVDHGANIEARDGQDRTPLLLAAGSHNDKMVKEAVRLLIELGANVNAADNTGLTVLHGVAQKEKMADLIPELLNAGAEINATDKNGETPLHLAADHKYLKSIKLLVERGANVELRNNDGDTPRMIAEKKRLSDWWVNNISR